MRPLHSRSSGFVQSRLEVCFRRILLKKSPANSFGLISRNNDSKKVGAFNQ